MPIRNPRKKSGDNRKRTVKVNSKTYKPHERAPRGTYKEAKINDAMKAGGERMRSANDPARLINSSLELYRENFPGSQIWPKLVSHFSHQAKQGLPYSVAGIADWEIDMHKPAGDTMSIIFDLAANKDSGKMEISANYKLRSRLPKYVSGFQVTVIVLFPDFIRNEIVIVPTVLPIKPVEDTSPYIFFIDIPAGSDSYLACFKADPCTDGAPDLDPGHPYRVMKILRSGGV